VGHMEGPFLIPIAAFAMVLGIVIANNTSNYYTRRMQSEERMAAIAKGIPLPIPESPAASLIDGYAVVDRWKRARALRTGGIVLIAIGIGVSIFSFVLEAIVRDHDVYVIAAAAIIPTAIGVGLLVDYYFQVRDLHSLGEPER
jgi:hypothetical protein